RRIFHSRSRRALNPRRALQRMESGSTFPDPNRRGLIAPMRISAGLPLRMTASARALWRVISGLALTGVGVAACSPEDPASGRKGAPNDPSPGGGQGGGTSQPPPPPTGGTTTAPPVMIGTGGAPPPVQACASETTRAVPAPLDIYLMLDIS